MEWPKIGLSALRHSDSEAKKPWPLLSHLRDAASVKLCSAIGQKKSLVTCADAVSSAVFGRLRPFARDGVQPKQSYLNQLKAAPAGVRRCTAMTRRRERNLLTAEATNCYQQWTASSYSISKYTNRMFSSQQSKVIIKCSVNQTYLKDFFLAALMLD
jgi:hypothetical protein